MLRELHQAERGKGGDSNRSPSTTLDQHCQSRIPLLALLMVISTGSWDKTRKTATNDVVRLWMHLPVVVEIDDCHLWHKYSHPCAWNITYGDGRGNFEVLAIRQLVQAWHLEYETVEQLRNNERSVSTFTAWRIVRSSWRTKSAEFVFLYSRCCRRISTCGYNCTSRITQ